MQNRETLSGYIDGHNVNGDFTDRLCRDESLQQKWANYHKIRDVMRGEEIMLGQDFSAKMAMLLENEEIEKPQQSEKPRGLLLKLKRWSVPLMQAGIAASVCFIAVLGVNMMNTNNDDIAQSESPALRTLPFTDSAQNVSYNAPAKTQPTAEQLERQQQRINALLQNHELQRRTNLNNITQTEAEKNKAQISSSEQLPEGQAKP